MTCLMTLHFLQNFCTVSLLLHTFKIRNLNFGKPPALLTKVFYVVLGPASHIIG